MDARHNGLAMTAPPFVLALTPTPAEVLSGPRIGMSKVVEQPWCYGLVGWPYLSRTFKV